MTKDSELLKVKIRLLNNLMMLSFYFCSPELLSLFSSCIILCVDRSMIDTSDWWIDPFLIVELLEIYFIICRVFVIHLKVCTKKQYGTSLTKNLVITQLYKRSFERMRCFFCCCCCVVVIIVYDMCCFCFWCYYTPFFFMMMCCFF